MPKNLIVRVGLDPSGYNSGMEKMAQKAESTSKRISKAMGNTTLSQRVGKSMGWSGNVSDASTQVNAGNIDAARQQLADLTAYKSQLQGLGFNDNTTDVQYGEVSERIRELTYDIKEYEAELQRQSETQNAAASSAQSLGQKLGTTSREASSSLLGKAAGAVRTLSQGFRTLASTAGSLAARGVKSAGSAIKSVGGWIKNMATHAKSSTNDIGRMVKSLRNVALVSAGLRIAGAAMGRLRSIVSEYISENATLQAQVNGLKQGMGQALAPAINLVANALSAVMPYILGVSNAIGQLMGALFGSSWTAAANGAKKTAAATGSAAKAQKEMNRQLMSFDEINKLSDNSSSDNSGGGGSGSGISPIESKTPEWLEQFKQSFTDLFNSEEFSSASIGGKVGLIINTLNTEVNKALSSVTFTQIGETLGNQFTDGVSKIDWRSLGSTIGMVMVMLPSIIVGFIYGTDWGLVGQSLSDMLHGAFTTVNEWMRSVDWLQLGDSLWQLISNVNWNTLASDLFSFLGLAIGGMVGMLWPTIANCATSIGDYFSEKIKEAGGNIPKGLWLGITEGLGNIWQWIKTNILDPFVSGFKDAFGIHSPSTVMAELGEYLMQGLTGGITSGITWVMDKLGDLKDKIFSIADRIKEAFDFEWNLPTLRLPHLNVEWDPVDNVLANFFGVTAFPRLSVSWFAKGGILDGAQIFGRMGSTLLGGGEYGREAVLPLDHNTGWMDTLAQRVVSMLSGQTGGDINLTIPVTLDGKEITRIVIKGLREYARANGGLAF